MLDTNTAITPLVVALFWLSGLSILFGIGIYSNKLMINSEKYGDKSYTWNLSKKKNMWELWRRQIWIWGYTRKKIYLFWLWDWLDAYKFYVLKGIVDKSTRDPVRSDQASAHQESENEICSCYGRVTWDRNNKVITVARFRIVYTVHWYIGYFWETHPKGKIRIFRILSKLDGKSKNIFPITI